MKIRTSSQDVIYNALAKVNQNYDGNITASVEWKGTQRNDKHVYNVKLGVASSKGPGGRRGFSGKRVAAACWHVFGDFFDALGEVSPDCEIQVAGLNDRKWTLAKDHGWQDRNIGSYYSPLMFSDACDCN